MSLRLTGHYKAVPEDSGDPALACAACDIDGIEVDKAEEEEAAALQWFIASTPQPDRADDVVNQRWKLAAYKRNPVVLWMHNRALPPIGTAEKMRVRRSDPRLELGVRWDDGEHNPLALTVAAQFRSKVLRAGSVGFRAGSVERRVNLPSDHYAYDAKSQGLYFDDNELLEFSGVTLPANPGALTLALTDWAVARTLDPVGQIEAVTTEIATVAERDAILRAVREDEQIRAAILDALDLPAAILRALQGDDAIRCEVAACLLELPADLPTPKAAKSASAPSLLAQLGANQPPTLLDRLSANSSETQ